MLHIDERGGVVVAPVAGEVDAVARRLCAELGPLVATTASLVAVHVVPMTAASMAVVSVREVTAGRARLLGGTARVADAAEAARDAVVTALCLGGTDVLRAGLARLRESAGVDAGIVLGSGATPDAANDEHEARLVALARVVPPGGRLAVETERGWYRVLDLGASRVALRVDAATLAAVDAWFDALTAARSGVAPTVAP